MNSNDGEQRIALVTGAAMGIGAAVAERLASDGYHVIVSDLKLDEATKTVDRMRESGLSADPLALDVGRAESLAEAFATVRARHCRCDVPVNNAGIAKTYPFVDFPLDNWTATLTINVTGTLLCSQHAARMMIERQWGRIVSIASVAGMRQRQQRAHRLRHVEGCSHRTHTADGGRARRARCHRECRRTRPCRHTDDHGAAQRAVPERIHQRHSDEALRDAGRNRVCGLLPCVGGICVHHRRDARCRRRVPIGRRASDLTNPIHTLRSST